MEIYIPDLYQKNIYNLDFQILKDRGIKYLIFDLDNTIALVTERHASKDAINLFNKLKSMGFQIAIASNSLNARVKVFATDLDIKYKCHCRKPKTDKILELINEFGCKDTEVAFIGDSMLDDIVSGNKIKITTVLTDQLGKREFIFSKIKRLKEKKIMKKLRDKNLFTKGRYYV